ncbi:MAG TPA: hypothetical protein VKA85_00440, partial [Candidatus Limnocylindrales bacterium]|nr:hypothetical protein [Candidatus Limnocylindrales bacterium]
MPTDRRTAASPSPATIVRFRLATGHSRRATDVRFRLAIGRFPGTTRPAAATAATSVARLGAIGAPRMTALRIARTAARPAA